MEAVKTFLDDPVFLLPENTNWKCLINMGY